MEAEVSFHFSTCVVVLNWYRIELHYQKVHPTSAEICDAHAIQEPFHFSRNTIAYATPNHQKAHPTSAENTPYYVIIESLRVATNSPLAYIIMGAGMQKGTNS